MLGFEDVSRDPQWSKHVTRPPSTTKLLEYWKSQTRVSSATIFRRSRKARGACDPAVDVGDG